MNTNTKCQKFDFKGLRVSKFFVVENWPAVLCVLDIKNKAVAKIYSGINSNLHTVWGL